MGFTVRKFTALVASFIIIYFMFKCNVNVKKIAKKKYK